MIDIAKRVGDAPYNAQQKWTELADLLDLLKPRKPKKILEIGVYKGGTMMAWTYIADDNAKLTGVDLPGGLFGGGFDSTEALSILDLYRKNQTIELVAMDSQNQNTVEMIRDKGQFDFIFIDGDHTYQGVKRDFDNYYPMLTEGGVLALHDIVDHNREDIGVHKLWAEVKKTHKTKEFIDLDFPTDSGVWGGIGVVYG